jgi:hypothetical protein
MTWQAQLEMASGGAHGTATLADACVALCEETRSKGEEYFGEGADNLTALVVELAPYL